VVTAGQGRLLRGDGLPVRVIDLADAGKVRGAGGGGGGGPARAASGAASGAANGASRNAPAV